ncbi:MAG: hypothetical protein ABSF03_34140 [Streptosporangiaceae bacterium]|jgi:hypothetical protein
MTWTEGHGIAGLYDDPGYRGTCDLTSQAGGACCDPGAPFRVEKLEPLG